MVEIRGRIWCRKLCEWWNNNEYVKMEDKGTDPMSDEDYDIVKGSESESLPIKMDHDGFEIV